ncbi:DNA repair and recombination protein RAD26 [Arthroderma uncinatum]|uniref:DNA repair and recombination protein RAD26 n=1 Tax=Arthroderma uncinatum TaxID=74035 RepID=UPI00144A70A3|nr:DNA repair and recombination protein RAD26 [Arthroderma uncinatum]KAF3492243.1 DNA repair and recombination protein RAD26 [Arthroderma uncinatum]
MAGIGIQAPDEARADSPETSAETQVTLDEPSQQLADETAMASQEAGDESSRLRALNADIRDQEDLERDITRQADKLLKEQANERDIRRLERTRHEKVKIESQILRLHQRLSEPIGTSARVKFEGDIKNAETRLTQLETDLQEIQQRIEERSTQEDGAGGGHEEGSAAGRLPNESRRDYLIRTGKITPFSRMSGGGARDDVATTLQGALLDAEEEREEEIAMEEASGQPVASHRHLMKPGFDDSEANDQFEVTSRPSKRRKVTGGPGLEASSPAKSDEDYADAGAEAESSEESSVEAEELDSDDSTAQAKRKKGKGKGKTSTAVIEDFKGVDDGDERVYQSRLRDWVQRRSEARDRAKLEALNLSRDDESKPDNHDAQAPEQEEWYLPHPTTPDTVLHGGYQLPGDIYPYLFDYQKTGVKWLWELHQQQVGGIIGDEMGLGKTIQVIGFLAGLHYSKKLNGPIIVVCPPTVMKQWVNEFHRWWPPFRVSILHTSGSGMVNLKSESLAEDRYTSGAWGDRNSSSQRGNKAARRILKRVLEDGHVLVTTYAGLQTYASLLIPVDWGIAVLDEGHKIRNPDTSITIHCKELRTSHRLILSGTPMQNNLTELWSLFDFVFPMRLGTLVNFRNQFEFPIRTGGYANASNLQVQTAAKCAETLKDAISPYLLQRFKMDVAADLPKKSEQVLFCKLTKIQRTAYEAFLASGEMSSILRGRREALYGIDMLRKICNHPDLTQHKTLSLKTDYNYGSGAKSGKMQVVKSLLELWRDTGHKTLLFAQHRIMLDILERFIKGFNGFNYRRMDGNTPIKARQGMVDEFNNDPDLHVFLLTTKVGGLGVNLTGADRVIIYDPDWNPSTDVQAHERAWRLGQKREVTIYRLMTAGTIEEKIYHRQIFKQFLANKILRDPKQRQTFQMSDIQDLFTLGGDGPTETSQMFKEADVVYEDDSAKGKGPRSTGQQQQRRRQAENKPAPKEEDQRISRVTGVAGVEEYQGEVSTPGTPQQPKDGDRTGSEKPDTDSRLMESIFSRSGVLSALEHDQIIHGKRTVKADPKIIETEAKRVAAEAAKELLKAEELARTVPVGTPTWTGQFGTAGRPGVNVAPSGTSSIYSGGGSTVRRAMGGPSSASLLANLANRSAGGGRTGSGTSSPSASASASASAAGTPRTGTPTGKDFMVMIRDYIITHGGAVHTQMLVDRFNRFCDSPRATAEFKEILRTIAVLDKSGSGSGSRRGKWVLKPEYAKK